MSRARLGVLLALAGCGSAPDARPADVPAAAVAPADSLALRRPDGTEIWFTAARQGADSAGATCEERVLEIRRGADTIPVPLLYTGEPPVLVDDTTVRAWLWKGCRRVDAYRVHLRTGRPEREP